MSCPQKSRFPEEFVPRFLRVKPLAEFRRSRRRFHIVERALDDREFNAVHDRILRHDGEQFAAPFPEPPLIHAQFQETMIARKCPQGKVRRGTVARVAPQYEKENEEAGAIRMIPSRSISGN